MTRKAAAPRTPTRDPASERQNGHHGPRELSPTRHEKSLSPVILVIERDSLLRWALFETLVEAGFRVLATPGSPCAEAWLQQIEQNVSLALVDDTSWPLPPAARAVLHDRWPTLPIVVMLHSDDAGLEARTREHGATDILVKPFDLPDLVHLVERLTGYPPKPAQATEVASSVAS
jgi:DNA-binding response OmpR family regulator